jgi:hypothetical protein
VRAVPLILAVSGLALLAAEASAAQPSLKGKWNITFCPYGRDFCTVTRCFDFDRVKGIVDGFPDSGTWTTPDAPGINGRWVQYGEKVSFFASYPWGSDSYAYFVFTGLLNGPDNIGGISLIETDRDFTFADTTAWYAQRAKSCPPPPTTRKGSLKRFSEPN